MQTTDTSNEHQLSRIKTYRNTSNSYSFFNLLTSDALLDKVEDYYPSTGSVFIHLLKPYRCFLLNP